LRAPSKSVPAVADTWRRQVGHTLRPRSKRHAAVATCSPGADEALRPSQTLQVRHTGLLVGEELAELDEGSRVVAASSGLNWPGFDRDRSL